MFILIYIAIYNVVIKLNNKYGGNMQRERTEIERKEYVDLEIAKSKNTNYTENGEKINDDTKLIIVGTVSPYNAKYYYCSPSNRIYGYLDATSCFANNDSLKRYRDELNEDNSDDEVIINKMKRELAKRKVAFIDGMKEVLRPKYDCKDSSIKEFVVDYDLFESYKDILKKVTIIVNSRLAEKILNKIFKVKELSGNIIFLSQRSGKKITWLEEIEKAVTK